MTYLTIELSDPDRSDEVIDAIDDWRSSWASTVTSETTIGSRELGIQVESAKDVIEECGNAVERALIVTINSSSWVGKGRLFALCDGELLCVDTVRGGENRGVDVVDYFRRHAGFEGVGYSADT